MATAVTPYDYTPTQARVVQLYDSYRSSLMNAKYYGSRLRVFKNTALSAEIVVALTSSSALASFAFWKSSLGQSVFTGLLVTSAIISALQPVFRLSEKVDRCSKLHYGYLEIYYRIESLLSDIRGTGNMTVEHQARAAEIAERYRALELEGYAYQSSQALLKLQDEVDRSLPQSDMWLPTQ